MLAASFSDSVEASVDIRAQLAIRETACVVAGKDGHVISASMQNAWTGLTRWLAAHAPRSHACLNPPADPAHLAESERRTGIAFPDDLRVLLSMNNGATASGPEFPGGATFLPGGHRLLSAAEIVQQHQMLTDILATTDEIMVGWWWHPQWVPFAVHVAADALAIDMRDGPRRGWVGEFTHEGNTNFDWGPSLSAVIEQIAACVRTNSDFKYFRPHVVDGYLDWEIIVERS